jgi:hypothetical protein
VNVPGDCNPAKLRTHFRGLEGLKKGAGGAEIGSVCREIALEAGRHGKTIGKDPIAVEMDRRPHPLHLFAGFFLAKGEGCQTKRGDKYRVLALCSLLPFLACSVSIWTSMDAIVVLAPTNYPKRNTRRSSTKLPKPSPASELQQFFDFPDVIGNACFHCRTWPSTSTLSRQVWREQDAPKTVPHTCDTSRLRH